VVIRVLDVTVHYIHLYIYELHAFLNDGMLGNIFMNKYIVVIKRDM